MTSFQCKIIKLFAVTAISIGAAFALVVLVILSSLGGSGIYQSAAVSPETDNVFVGLGQAFLVLLVHLSWLYLAAFILGFWFFSVCWISRDDLISLKHKIKRMIGVIVKASTDNEENL